MTMLCSVLASPRRVSFCIQYLYENRGKEQLEKCAFSELRVVYRRIDFLALLL